MIQMHAHLSLHMLQMMESIVTLGGHLLVTFTSNLLACKDGYRLEITQDWLVISYKDPMAIQPTPIGLNTRVIQIKRVLLGQIGKNLTE